MDKFIQAITSFDNGAQVFVNNQEMFGYNISNQTINTSYSIIPLANITTVTTVE